MEPWTPHLMFSRLQVRSWWDGALPWSLEVGVQHLMFSRKDDGRGEAWNPTPADVQQFIVDNDWKGRRNPEVMFNKWAWCQGGFRGKHFLLELYCTIVEGSCLPIQMKVCTTFLQVFNLSLCWPIFSPPLLIIFIKTERTTAQKSCNRNLTSC